LPGSTRSGADANKMLAPLSSRKVEIIPLTTSRTVPGY